MILLAALTAVGHKDVVAAGLGFDLLDLAGLGVVENLVDPLFHGLVSRVVEVVEQQRQRRHQDDQVDKAIFQPTIIAHSRVLLPPRSMAPHLKGVLDSRR